MSSSCQNSLFPNPPCSGDAIPLKLTFKDKATGNPYNLTGATVGITVKIAPSDEPDTNAVFKQDVAGDTTGIIQFYVDPLAVGSYWLDVKMWNGSQHRSTVIAPAKFSVVQSVTSR